MKMNKCGTCKHYTGAGDFDLCCMKSKRRLCYRNDDACEEWEENQIKHTYYVVMDGQVITTLSDRKGIHPVYAISLMGQALSEMMEKAEKETWPEALEEVRKPVRLDV